MVLPGRFTGVLPAIDSYYQKGRLVKRQAGHVPGMAVQKTADGSADVRVSCAPKSRGRCGSHQFGYL